MSEKELDWELDQDYYNSGEDGKSLSLEDFITESEKQASGLEPSGQTDELLRKTIADVRQVMALAQEGKNIGEIASMTGLSEKYVYDIQVCAQGFREDDEIAVAHLILG
ncbi:helix-turn-helix domain-containing protein [Lacrimispora brassicae]